MTTTNQPLTRKEKIGRRTIIHYTPSERTPSVCGLMLPTLVTNHPARTTCKRCVAAMMPGQRAAWNEAQK